MGVFISYYSSVIVHYGKNKYIGDLQSLASTLHVHRTYSQSLLRLRLLIMEALHLPTCGIRGIAIARARAAVDRYSFSLSKALGGTPRNPILSRWYARMFLVNAPIRMCEKMGYVRNFYFPNFKIGVIFASDSSALNGACTWPTPNCRAIGMLLHEDNTSF